MHYPTDNPEARTRARTRARALAWLPALVLAGIACGIESDEIGYDGADDVGDEGPGDTALDDEAGEGTDGNTEAGATDADTGEPPNCADLTDQVLELGTISIEVDTDDGLVGSCGGDGPEAVFEFTAGTAGDYRFVVTEAAFTPVLYVVTECEPLDELACDADNGEVTVALEADQVVWLVVDSSEGQGSASLTAEML